MTRAIVSGSRGYMNRRRVFQVLDAAVERLGLDCVITTGAMGVGYIAQAWARDRKVANEIVRAQWGKHPRDAGALRNREIIETRAPDLLIAFPGDEDTADITARAEAAGLRVIRIDPDQHVREPEEGLLL